MLLCSNIAFRYLDIKILADWLLIKRMVSFIAGNSLVKKVLVFHSPHRVLSRFKNIINRCKNSFVKNDLSIQAYNKKFPIFTTREVDKITGLGQRINKGEII
ncbi:MAG: hypothetical protein GY797_39915 [Deltaproteobacteria bacterium]|nr:hypothetical protein [Deltaproteobacteria bacterium]